MKKFFIILIILALAISVGFINNLDSIGGINKTADPTASAQVKLLPSGVLPAQKTEEPARIVIPKLKIDAKIENVGLTSEGAMDTPKGKGNVGWYDLGVKPGEKGNAVMAGHLDDKNGDPEVFYSLSDLSAGDEISIEDSAGKQFEFVVTQVKSYPQEQFPLQEVFGQTDKHRLNLITCKGVFDPTSRLYSQRLVIYTELKT